jgi:hypothetical protein
MNRARKFRCDPASWTKGSHSLTVQRPSATPFKQLTSRKFTKEELLDDEFRGTAAGRDGVVDGLYRFHQWQANLRVLNIREIKTVPYVPRSHPVVERLIGPYGANVWIAWCSGPRLISSGSSSSSSTTQRASHACGTGRSPAGGEP